MTRLLVSVRSAVEAQVALAGGAEVVDVKEPLRGSLGAADAETIEAVVRAVAGRAKVSAALGELLAGGSLNARLAGRLQYAKFGLAGCIDEPNWITRFRQAVARLPEGIRPVAVVYADWKSARAPDPGQVLELAQAIGCGAVLVDTCDKTQGSLLEHWPLAEVVRFVTEVRQSGMLSVIAGGLGRPEIAEIVPLAPDYIAVRGAACHGARTGRIDIKRVRHLSMLVKRAGRAELNIQST
jgi:(5-formylfuran-3-yl)methyl phosphate synthase